MDDLMCPPTWSASRTSTMASEEEDAGEERRPRRVEALTRGSVAMDSEGVDMFICLVEG